MAQTAEKSFQKANYGLRREILSPMETLAQSVSTMAPSTTPAATMPLVCALAGNGTWLAYVLATAPVLLVALCIARYARHSSSPALRLCITHSATVAYSAESKSYTAAGISAYNALQAHVEKRMRHGLQVGFSYTYSHATNEQSAMGLLYNGNNPLNLRSGYGLSDFDRKQVLNFTYTYQLPKLFSVSSVKGNIADGWAISGLTVIQSTTV